eukprot:9491106-Pyramimonas_sp.AAC.1
MKDVLSLPQCRGAITCLQEHHGGEQRLPELQHTARQLGLQGVLGGGHLYWARWHREPRVVA